MPGICHEEDSLLFDVWYYWGFCLWLDIMCNFQFTELRQMGANKKSSTG